jgi:CHAT domain-containing protein
MHGDELYALLGIADLHFTERDLPAALAELSRGATLSRQYARPDQEARFLQRLGILYSEAGDDETAREHWHRALALHHAAGNPTGEAAVLMQLGDLAAELGDTAEAERSYRKAAEMFVGIGQKLGEARALRRLGNLLTERGNYAQAVELHERALKILRELGSPQSEVLTMAALARAKAGAGDRSGAAALLKSALALARGPAVGLHEAQILGELAILARERGALKQALQHLDEALALLEREQRAALVPSLQATLSGDAQQWYAERTDLLMRMGQPARALECSERARARALLGLLAESRVDLRQGVDEALLARYRAMEVRLSEADRARSPEVSALTSQLHALETEIRRASPAYAGLTQPTPLSVEEIRTRVLDEGTLLIEFALGEKASWVFVLGKDGLVTASLPPSAEIEAAAAALHGRLAARQSGEAEAAALSRLLLLPLAARLEGAWSGLRLAIVPDGALQYVPFAALPVGTPPRALIEAHEIVVLPSASALDVMRREVEGRAPAPRKVALLGDPVFDASDPRVRPGSAPAAAPAVLPGGTRGFPRLPFSRDEVKAIAALLPPSEVLEAIDFKASRALAMDGSLARYRAVHIATHGLLNTVRPELSGVVLSLVDERGAPQDGFLRLQDIYNLHLSADLVVLSACQTALGRAIAGEGLVGLTRGFMHAGAPRVVASLWRVDDSATAELMSDFYRGMLKEGLPAAAALRSAQRKLAHDRRFASPFYWAGFTLQGDWR